MSMTLSRRTFAAYILVAIVLSAVVSGAGVYYLFLPRPTEERTLVISVWGGAYYDGAKKIADEFTKTTGIRTVVTTHTGVLMEAVPKIEASMPDPVIDVLYCSIGHFPTLIEKNLIAPVDETVVTNLGDTPKVAKWIQDGKTYGVAMYVASNNLLVYRTDYVKEPIDELKDLLRPDLKGKVLMIAPDYDVGLFVVYYSLANGGDEYHPDKGFELMKKFAEAGAYGVIAHDDPTISRAISTGEAWVAIGIPGDFYPVYKQGVPLKPVKVLKDFPTAPIGWDGLAVVNGPRKDLAMQYLKFALQPDKAAQWTNDVGMLPVNLKAPVLNPELLDWNLSAEEVAKYGYLRDVKYCSQHWDEWQTRFEEEIKALIG